MIACILFYVASGYSKTFLLLAVLWLSGQAILGLTGFYTVTNTVPPRFVMLPLPPLILIVLVFATKRGRQFIDKLDIKLLTWLHTVRIGVEVTLFVLALYQLLPALLTFEGRNFDIISGVSAPFVAYFGFSRNLLSRGVLLTWNFLCLALLINVVVYAVLSVPSSFQQFGTEQPNVAVLYCPFVWLPACIVPIVLFSHLAAIRQLLDKNRFYGRLHITVINRETSIGYPGERKTR
jgi:hypothetical protein